MGAALSAKHPAETRVKMWPSAWRGSPGLADCATRDWRLARFDLGSVGLTRRDSRRRTHLHRGRNIIETGTDSYRRTRTRQRLQDAQARCGSPTLESRSPRRAAALQSLRDLPSVELRLLGVAVTLGGDNAGTSSPAGSMSPWRFVVMFGTVSLLADFVYEGARSITGPLLASLGASAVLVGFVTGAGEAAALGLRLLSGPMADRTKRFWAFTVAGYALTVVTVPLLGLTGALWAACVLVIAERVGKAIRSPAKDTLLSHATSATGRGRGFAVHEALDQIGAVIGPLTVAGVLVLSGGDYTPALLVLAAPGVAVLALLM